VSLEIIAEVSVSRSVFIKDDLNVITTLDSLIGHYKSLTSRDQAEQAMNMIWAEFYTLLKKRIQTGKY